jgi:hypothetical protein
MSYLCGWHVDRKLLPIPLVVKSCHIILRAKSMIVSVVGPSAHEMILTNAKDEEMSNETTVAKCEVLTGTFAPIKRRSHCLQRYNYITLAS